MWTVLALVGWCASIAPAQSFRQDVDLRALSLSTKSFDELKREYLRLVESLQRDAQRFRDSLPVYQDFLDTLVNVALPLQVRCELARLKAVTYYAP
ncbi:MAG: hypothetical protein GWP08_06735, partial [Nitrospiraceae bacterium]|nr:hypothetical protein [Nitrospiraceae bacterium]